ncbi:MAG: hypothetical protein JW768_05110 [Chitinispirillaceae bacterium]|nr:hypothetical protein [Chitinispirillaceae bacterium]
MRLSNLLWVILMASVALWAAESQKYVQAKKGSVGVYKNRIREVYEQPIFKVGTVDRLLVLDSKGQHYMVKNVEGQTGWVEKQLVIAIGKSKTFVFDNAEVMGYLDAPTPVYIIDSDDPNAERIYLDRSFKDALRDNVDKETIERQVK